MKYTIIRILGVLLGIFLIVHSFDSRPHSPPSNSAIIVGIVQGILLILPYSRIKRDFLFWFPFVLLTLVVVGYSLFSGTYIWLFIKSLFEPNSTVQGAWKAALMLLIMLPQPFVIWKIRTQHGA